MRHTLTIAPNGEVTTLYTEAIDLTALGPLTMRRASAIEFNADRQAWEVTVSGEVLFRHPSRAECLRWEHEYFNANLL
jgi:hypothetical protein